MKCPKCSYISFDGAERCRNCGYDFALARPAGASELPLRDRDAAGSPIADLPLDDRAATDARPRGPERRGSAADAAAGGPPLDLPLFDAPVPGVDDTPLITAPAPPRPPLAVRRPAPEPPRPKPGESATPERSRRQAGTRQGPLLGDVSDAAVDSARPHGGAAFVSTSMAPTWRRVGAAVFDAALIGAIDAVVLYFTLQLTALPFARVTDLPLVPLLGFFAVLNGGYLVGFTTASGQTLGKMLTGIRIVGETTTRVPLGNAIVRALAIVLTLASLGVGYIPALTGRDRRALHDRLAGTKVLPC